MKAITVYEKRIAAAEDVGSSEAPEPGLTRVRVKYAGVGFADVMAVRGGYPLAPKRPFSPGYEFLGRVEASCDPTIAAGTRVAGMIPRMGAYRELIDVDPCFVVPVPPDLSDETAALLPLNYLTALAMIERCAHLEKGQSFLIHGAAGGVGTAALELARTSGLRAYGSASKAKRDLIASLGGIPLRREDGAWIDELKALEGGGVDAAFDAFGAASFRKSWRSLSRGGTLVCYGMSPSIDGGNADFVAGLLYLAAWKAFGRGRRVAICGAPAIIRRDQAWYRASMARIFALAESGALKPTLAGIVPWDRVSEAHRRLAEGSTKGKILLDFS
jgi:NADPH:quinone reductase-like Zn-dependent oxidoreductase